jgi:hypothetical protein
MPKCWTCNRPIPPGEAVKVGFLGVSICRKCEDRHYAARNKISLPEWEAGFKKYAQLNGGRKS